MALILTPPPITAGGGGGVISGTVEIDNATGGPISVSLAGVSTAANQATEITSLNALLTDAQLRATPVPVSGTVIISDGAGPVTVDGTVAIAGTVPVSGTVAVTGGLTDTQIRATPLPVSGTVTITDGSGPVTVDGTVAISGTVPVSGTVSVTGVSTAANQTSELTKLDTLHTDILALPQVGTSVKTLGPIVASGMTNVLYTSGDVIGNVFTFPNAARANGGSGLITGAMLFDPGKHMDSFDIELHVFSATLSAGGDNAAYVLTDAESFTEVGWIKWTGSEWVGNANNSMNMQQGKSIGYTCAAGSTSLFGILIARGAVTATATATDAQVSLMVVRD